MKVTITTLTDIILTLDVSPDMELDNFKALCECEAGIPSQEIVVMHEGLPLLDDKKDLKTYGIKEGDVLLLQQFLPQRLPLEGALSPLGIDFSTIRLPATGSQDSQGAQSTSQTGKEDDPEYIGEMLLSNPEHLSLLKQNNPKLAEALLSGNKEKFSKILKKQLKEKADKERKRIHMMNADPFDPEAQRLIAEEIRQDNVDSNMEAAMEHHPESFGQVIMLYINCRVNGHPVKAFIDSGAQTTIMSQACAERCSIMRLVDRRWAGIAKGVGTQKIIGRVHLGQIQIEEVFLTSSFSILEDQPMDMLLGLDMLKRHQCCIDLKRNILVIGTTGTETPFLHEGELPLDGIHNIRDFPIPCEDDEKEEAMKLLEARYRSVVDASRAGQASNPTTLNSGSDTSFSSGTGDSKSGCSSAHSQETIALGDSFTEANVQNLVNLGFSRQQVIEELRRCNGDTNQAMAALFAKSLRLP